MPMISAARAFALRYLLSMFAAACGAAPGSPPKPTRESTRDPAGAEITGIAVDPEVERKLAPNKLCPDPGSPCPDTMMHAFEPYELPFNPEIQERRDSLDSLSFFAVVLDTRKALSDGGDPKDETGAPPKKACGGFFDEEERLSAQMVFPRRKVFASRHGCKTSVISYAGLSPDENVLAVYAGAKEDEARATLAEALRRFPKSKLVRTRVQLLTFN